MSRRAIVYDYEDILSVVEEIRNAGTGLEAIRNLSECIDDLEQLVEKAETPRELGLDATVLQISSLVIQENATKDDSNFKAIEFADKLLKHLEIKSERPESSQSHEIAAWCRLSEEFGNLVPLRPSFDYINGTYDREGFIPKKQAPRQRKQTANQVQQGVSREAAKKLSERVHINTEGDQSQREILNMIKSKIKELQKGRKRKPINYFQFVLNPYSFEETCQNILNVAFLVNDSLLKMYMEDDELYMVPIKPVGNDMGGMEKEEMKRQFLIQMSKKEWKELVEAYEITEPMINFGIASRSRSTAV
ncbi:non-structural maintenance of chromosomes element 4 homolog A-like [Ischnura elegans]|uniref:non-structural maintenance of chromosomes element 4 homolog A-like n=1 Tax=Ischnura elegans TaxID=197161 RepID=UPI001ED8762E|nr:non-structural maintenance of chromosomes element 4 homolog A-like [Ischnura elegans]XP_046400752.1 non-structural maintenance of chromosomes element 4 homolog A-like [Ischnura elegans]